MWLLLKLAGRSAFRHRWRSLLTGLAIALGLTLVLVFEGITSYGYTKRIWRHVRYGSGHVLVQPPGFLQRRTLDRVIPDPDAILAKARSLPGIEHATVRVQGFGLLSSGAKSSSINLVGTMPSIEPTASTIASERKRIAGHYPRPRDQLPHPSDPADVYIGKRLAESLDLELGDRVVITVTPRGTDATQSAAFLVRGIFQTKVKAVDGYRVEIDIAEARKLYGLGEAATQVALVLEDGRDSNAIRDRLIDMLAGRDDVQVITWETAIPIIKETAAFENSVLGMLMSIILLIAAVGIFNTQLMSIVERTREFGVMRAIGTSPTRMSSMIIFETLILAGLFIGLGAAGGYGLHRLIVAYGIDPTVFYGKDIEVAGLVIEDRIRSVLYPSDILFWSTSVGIIVLVSALYPAYRAGRIQPKEALEHV